MRESTRCPLDTCVKRADILSNMRFTQRLEKEQTAIGYTSLHIVIDAVEAGIGISEGAHALPEGGVSMKVVVIMPFAKDFDPIYTTIKRAINAMGPHWRCMRIDRD